MGPVLLAGLLGCAGLTELADSDAITLFPKEPVSTAGPLAIPAHVRDPSQHREAYGASARERARAISDPGATLPGLLAADMTLGLLLAMDPPTRDMCTTLAGLDETNVLGLARCGDPAHASRFEAANEPHQTLAWASLLAFEGHPVPPFALDHARQAVLDGGSIPQAGDLLFGVCDTDRPELAEPIRALVEAGRSSFGAELAVHCPHQSDRGLATAHREACARTTCSPLADPMADPDGAVRSWDGRIAHHLRRFPGHRSTLLTALERCIADPDETASSACLTMLASEDWARARAAAEGRVSDDLSFTQLHAALARFDSEADLRAHLEGLGLTLNGPGAVAVPLPGTGAFPLLYNGGAIAEQNGPYASSWLVYEMVAKIPELSDVAVEVRPAPVRPDDSGLMTLRFWRGTTRYQALMPTYGEGTRVAGILNGVLEAEGSSTRVALLPIGWDLVFGPEAALQSLHDDGLLLLQEHFHGTE